MPFSFTQIEQEKTGTIQISLAFLLFFYFISALVIVYAIKAWFYFSAIDTTYAEFPGWPSLDGQTILLTLAGACIAGAIHWQFSQNGLINRILAMMGGRPPDDNRQEERIFRNVVDEAHVATGGKYRIEPYILPTAALNAFALQDFEGRSIIGITEGLLMRLNRAQLEAVIAHEAGHVASGDCLQTTTTSCLFKTFDNICDITSRLLTVSSQAGYIGATYHDRESRHSNDGRMMLFFLMLFLLASVLRFIGFLGSMFISRQREYRADAISVKLTRNPLALAEALHIISNRWKGSGMPGENMEAIFISNPHQSNLEQTTGVLAELFTTHPPVEKRIAILLDMAHATRQDLDAALLKARVRFEAVKDPEIQEQPVSQVPLKPVMIPGLPAEAAASASLTEKDHCPRCCTTLAPQDYEGVSVLSCPGCGGVLVTERDVLHIVHTRDKVFDEAIRRQGDLLHRQVRPLRLASSEGVYDEKSIVCPACLDTASLMHRRFVNPKFPVEVDKCPLCRAVWFDRDELEVLQYLYEIEHPVRV
ncbi:MAG: M48 family metalloprotease [Candidatus Omnitrophota bacterium]